VEASVVEEALAQVEASKARYSIESSASKPGLGSPGFEFRNV